jgi:tRNA pseudouridine38-40 synthase
VIYDIIAVKEAHARFDALKEPMRYHINTFKDPFCKSKAGTFIKN